MQSINPFERRRPRRKLPRLVKAVSLAEHDLIVAALTDQLEWYQGVYETLYTPNYPRGSK